jgi:hypothetical protein
VLFANRKPAQLLQSCEESIEISSTQGFKANPGLELANAFSVIRHTLRFHTVSVATGQRFI